MKTFRYSFLMLFLLVPALAVAQQETTDVTLEAGTSEFTALGAAWDDTVPFIAGMNIGPADLVIVEGDGTTPDAPPDEGCDPYTPDNAAMVKGNIAFVQRGVCAFVLKTQNASAAGAIAVVIYNDERVPDDDETLVSMGGDPCGPAEGCTAPAAFISRASGLAVLTEIKFGEQGTLVPEEPPPPPPSTPVDNGTVVTSLFDNGFIGSDPTFAFGEGFAFNGEQGLFVSSFLVATDDGAVAGNPYDGASEYENTVPVMAIASPDAPFTVGAETEFTGNEDNVGVTVAARLQSLDGAPYAIADFDVTNTSGAALSDVYLGLFSDLDVGSTSVDDGAGFDSDLNLVYVFDPVEEASYFGVTLISVDGDDTVEASGYSADATAADDAQLTTALTSNVEVGVDPAERATVIGAGPFDMADGETVTVRFAYVAGTDLGNIQENAARARDLTVTVEETTQAGTFVLESAYPNPLSSKTTIGFELPEAQDVRLAVYDVLGREVAVLVDGTRQAGPQTVEFDAANLPSGVYVYRLVAGATQLSQQVTIVR